MKRALICISQDEQWPDLFQFLRSNAPRAAYTMSVLADTAGESIIPNLAHFIEIYGSALQNSTADPESAYYTIITLTHLVSHFLCNIKRILYVLATHFCDPVTV